MENPINENVFDSRDLIEYKEYLESDLVEAWNDLHEDTENFEEAVDIEDVDFDNEVFEFEYSEDIAHYRAIRDFVEELEGYGDFEYGEAIIHEDYFTEYCKDFVQSIGDLPKDIPSYIEDNINWDGVADDLEADYMSADYDGSRYLMRA